MVKYICDCCGKELKDEECFRNINFIKTTENWESELEHVKIKKQVCKLCYNKYLQRCGEVFYKLQKERNEK